MILLHILGSVIVAVGLGLFVFTQVKGKTDKESTMAVWKINLSGPPALVLILVGALIFVFPFTSFFENPENPKPPEQTTSTVTASPDPSVTTTLVPEVGLPLAPASFEVVFDETCGADAIFWDQPEIENVTGWWISLEAHTLDTDEVFSFFELDTAVDSLTYGNSSGLCYFDFTNELALNYWIWIYAYNDAGFSEPLFVEYADL